MPFYVNTQNQILPEKLHGFWENVLSVISGTGLKLCFCALEVTG